MGKRSIKQAVQDKTCGTCKEDWPADLEFFYSGGAKDGLMGECKACYNAWRRVPRPYTVDGSLTLELQGLFSRLVQKPEQSALSI